MKLNVLILSMQIFFLRLSCFSFFFVILEEITCVFSAGRQRWRIERGDFCVQNSGERSSRQGGGPSSSRQDHWGRWPIKKRKKELSVSATGTLDDLRWAVNEVVLVSSQAERIPQRFGSVWNSSITKARFYRTSWLLHNGCIEMRDLWAYECAVLQATRWQIQVRLGFYCQSAVKLHRAESGAHCSPPCSSPSVELNTWTVWSVCSILHPDTLRFSPVRSFYPLPALL